MNSVTAYISAWNIQRANFWKRTASAELHRGLLNGKEIVLKIFLEGQSEEALSIETLVAFSGRGMVSALKSDSRAILMPFLPGQNLHSFFNLHGKLNGELNVEFPATEVVCELLSRIHGQRPLIPDVALSMQQNFESLFKIDEVLESPLVSSVFNEKDFGGIKPTQFFRQAATWAQELLETEKDICLLHGDVHHENIVQDSEGSWVLIDPKSLYGERTYDYLNFLYNPAGDPWNAEILFNRAKFISSNAKIDLQRLLKFAVVFGALAAAWKLEDRLDCRETLEKALALEKLKKSLLY